MSLDAVTKADITSADWSLMLDSTAADLGYPTGIGRVVQGVDDVDQCINIILTSPPGSDPFRPTFACDIFQFLDKPMTIAMASLVAEVVDAITKWEPRVTVLGVTAVANPTQGYSNLQVTVTWQLNLSQSKPQTTTVTIGGQS